jgi:hypothetical protein
MGQVSVSAKLMDSDPDFLEKYKRKFKAETGFDVNYYTKEKFMPGQNLFAESVDSDNKVILGCLKMVYEFAVACIPEYFEDNIAIAFSDMLKQGSINHDFADYLVPALPLHPIIEMNLEKFPELKEFHIVIMIEEVDSVGLVACIKLFEKYLIFKLSRREDYLDERILILLNDSVNAKARCTFLKGASSISLNFGNLPESDKPKLDSSIPLRVYNSDCTMAVAIDDRSTVPIYRNLDYKLISKINRIEDFSEGLYVKCIDTGKLYLLHSLAFNYR